MSRFIRFPVIALLVLLFAGVPRGVRAQVAEADVYSVDEGDTLRVAAPGLLSNDTPSTGLTAAIDTEPDHGPVIIESDGSFVYIHDGSETSVDAFIYAASNAAGASDLALVTINVNPLNDRPVTADLSVIAQAGEPLHISLEGSDAEDQPITYRVLGGQVYGDVTTPVGNMVTYTPDPGFIGEDEFFYVANDGLISSLQSRVVITVEGNVAPVAVDDEYEVDEDEMLTVLEPSGVLSNDTDEEDADLTALVIDTTKDGTLTLAEDGSFTYSPFENFNGQDSFTYSASDGIDSSPQATVVINVNPTGNSRVQFMLNAPDALLNPADVYMDGERIADDEPFRSASAFMDIPDGTHTFAIAGSGSASAADAVETFPGVVLTEGQHYILVANGTTDTGLGLDTYESARETGSGSSGFDMFVANGSPDVPMIDVNWVSDTVNYWVVGPVATGLEYRDRTTYLGRQPRAYNFEVRDVGGEVLDVFRFDLSADGGKAVVLISSGLQFAPSGEYGFRLVAVDGSGNVRMGSVVTSVGPDPLVPKTFLLRGNYPNPFNPTTRVGFDLPDDAEVSISVMDLLGREVLSVPPQSISAGSNRGIALDAADVSSGIYIYKVIARAAKQVYTAAGTMTLIK